MRLTINYNVFEFGLGNGLKFWAACAYVITSVEFDRYWYEYGTRELLSNQTILLRTGEEYVNAIHYYHMISDVIVVDVGLRYNCALEALRKIEDVGIIILDNSEWFPNTVKLLRDAGFTQVDFIGAGPINFYVWCSSIFFRKQLNIPRIKNSVKVLKNLIQVCKGEKWNSSLIVLLLCGKMILPFLRNDISIGCPFYCTSWTY